MTAPADERVEVVDRSGVVERVVTRAEMRRDRLRHRCTYIAVIDADDRLVVHRRADWKDVWPGRWDVAFGGVAAVGESWDDAAARELAEEAGVAGDLHAAGVATFDDPDVSVLGHVYVVRHDGPFTIPDGEVVELDRVPLADLDAWLDGRALCPDSVALVVPAVRSARPVS